MLRNEVGRKNKAKKSVLKGFRKEKYCKGLLFYFSATKVTKSLCSFKKLKSYFLNAILLAAKKEAVRFLNGTALTLTRLVEPFLRLKILFPTPDPKAKTPFLRRP